MKHAFLFDLDGVLVDSKEIHFNALNMSLNEIDPDYVITKEEQASIYEGLTTRSKLEILNKLKGLPVGMFEAVWQSKQNYTAELFSDIRLDQELVDLFSYIHYLDISIGVVSNSVRKTLDACLSGLGVDYLIDLSISNEDVFNPKPSPDGYLLAMKKLEVSPSNTVIFEDSPIGIQAATKSKAHVFQIENRSSLTFGTIDECLKLLKVGNK